jgi:hypothetical protein
MGFVLVVIWRTHCPRSSPSPQMEADGINVDSTFTPESEKHSRLPL